MSDNSSSSNENDHSNHVDENSADNKRNRYQYSCLECQRRKQRCSRTFPCEKCVQRGISHLCSPPTNLHRPSRRVRMRLSLANNDVDKAKDKNKDKDKDKKPSRSQDMDPYELSEEGSNSYSSEPIAPQHAHISFEPSTSQLSSGFVNPHLRSPSYIRSHLLYQQDQQPQQHALPSASPTPRMHSNTGVRTDLHRHSQAPPYAVSPSDISSSSLIENDAQQYHAARLAEQRSNHMSRLPMSGTNPLAQLATVAQWPALQSQPPMQHTTHAPYPQQAEFSSSSALVTTQQTARPALDSDQRSIVDADDAFIGRPALNGLGWNPFRRHEGMGTDLLSWTGQLGRGFGLVIPKYELRSVQQSLPSRAESNRLLNVFLEDYNWSRFPASPQDLTKAVNFCIERCPLSDDVQMLPLMAFTLSIFCLATLDLASRPYPTRSSRTYFFAARKALSLSESLGLHTLDSLSASLNLCRYLDLCRVPRSTWLQVASCMRGAIDLGLHLDGSHLGQNCSSTLQRRILWSHLVHQDREWSVLFGRPMTEIPFSSTPRPSLNDYLSAGLDITCAQYLVVRDSFRFHIERISQLFQEIAASSQSSPSPRIYQQALDIDAGIIAFMGSLPPCLSASLPMRGLNHQDFSTTFYHHLTTNQILFFRSLLHRPFWMESMDMLSAEKYKLSRQICVELALQDLRGRRQLSRRLPVTMVCHLFGSAYSLLSMNTIIASDILFSLEFAEPIHSDDVLEKLGYIHEYVASVRANIQESRGDHLAVKELYVMRSLLKRIQDKVQTLNPQSLGFQVLGVRYGGGCADRLAMTLSELSSAANLLLNMARAGVRVDDATRIPPSGEDSTSNFTPPGDSLELFLSNADEWLSSLLNPTAAAQPADEGFTLF